MVVVTCGGSKIKSPGTLIEPSWSRFGTLAKALAKVLVAVVEVVGLGEEQPSYHDFYKTCSLLLMLNLETLIRNTNSQIPKPYLKL